MHSANMAAFLSFSMNFAFLAITLLGLAPNYYRKTTNNDVLHQHGIRLVFVPLSWQNSGFLVKPRRRADGARFSFAVTKSSKRGSTCLHVPGEDIFLGLTVCMDVQRNPRPQGKLERVPAVSGLAEGRLLHSSQDGVTRWLYTREKLIFLRSRAGYSAKHLPLNVLHKLRDLQILKYRGKRGGKRKEALTRTSIPTHITPRISPTRSCKRSHANLRLLKGV